MSATPVSNSKALLRYSLLFGLVLDSAYLCVQTWRSTEGPLTLLHCAIPVATPVLLGLTLALLVGKLLRDTPIYKKFVSPHFWLKWPLTFTLVQVGLVLWLYLWVSANLGLLESTLTLRVPLGQHLCASLTDGAGLPLGLSGASCQTVKLPSELFNPENKLKMIQAGYAQCNPALPAEFQTGGCTH